MTETRGEALPMRGLMNTLVMQMIYRTALRRAQIHPRTKVIEGII